jgi:hypothetical protein
MYVMFAFLNVLYMPTLPFLYTYNDIQMKKFSFGMQIGMFPILFLGSNSKFYKIIETWYFSWIKHLHLSKD